DDADPDGFSRALWKEMAALGWAGMLLPEEYGGVDFGVVGLGTITQEAGRTLAATPLISTVALASRLILNGGDDTQRKTYLPRIATGELLACLAIDEGAHHTAIPSMQVVRADGGWRLSGDKTMVIDGHIADVVLVAAKGDNAHPAVFAINAETPGLTVTRLNTVDSRNLANMSFKDVQVTEANRLGYITRAVLDDALDVARSALASEMLGGAVEAFERTIDYLKMRDQFGQPIGSFQALQHRAATLFGEVELGKSTVIAALSGFDEGANNADALASLAKAKTNKLFQSVSQEAIQMHGGIGMTDDEEIGFFIKRARACEQLLGTQRFHRARYASLNGF
ncbi:MAG: acyl-CoA dehydrogenase family protein, partial [Pseudomonadota bacterium]